jgi:uncharacterized membrane protein
MELIVKLLAVGGVMGVLDFLWLRFAARKLYESEMPGMLLDKPNALAAAGFYVIYVVGVVYFVVTPALEKGSWMYALGSGALLGLFAYATYGLTNLAVFKGFTTKAVLIDLAWGAFLTASASVAAYFIVKALL